MRKWMTGILLAALVLFAITARAQEGQETGAMLRAFGKTQLYAQGFEVRYTVKKTPAQAVPLLQKANTLAKTLPDGSVSTKEEKETTHLTLRCRVAPEKSAVQGALARMRRLLGTEGESIIYLYGLLQENTKTEEEVLRALMEALNDVVRSTRRGKQRLALLGDAYQAAAQQEEGRVRIAIARPHFISE